MSEARIAIRRQDAADRPETRRWETFSTEVGAATTLSEALCVIRRRPVTIEGKLVAPVAFESACASDGCGACTLLVNRRVRAACRTRVREVLLRDRVELEPLSKFPLVRDLWVDRRGIRDSFVRSAAGVEQDAALVAAPKQFAVRDRCVECGACLEACPEWGPGSPFLGAAALNEAELLRMLTPEPEKKAFRLVAVAGDGGVACCGKAQNCVAVCPEKIPLFDSILALERDATRHWLRTLLRR